MRIENVSLPGQLLTWTWAGAGEKIIFVGHQDCIVNASQFGLLKNNITHVIHKNS